MADMERGAYVRMLSAVYAAMFLIRVAFGIVVVTFADYVATDDEFIYSLVVTSSPLLELITVVFAGVLIDRYGRKGILLTGLGLGAISMYGLALTTNPLLLTFVNGLHGIAAALILVTTLAIIATYAPEERRGREMGFFNLANLVGWIAGFTLGEILADLLVGRLAYTFVIAGGLGTIGLLYTNRMLKLPPEARNMRSKTPSMRELLRAVGNRDIILLTLPWLIVFMLVGALITFFPRVSSDLAISGGATAMGILFIGVLLMASQVFWGRLADRYGREGIMVVGGIGFAFLMSIIVFAFFESPDHISTRAVETFEVEAPAAASFVIMAAARAEGPGDPVPIIDRVEPRGGGPGTRVTITGRGLANVTEVLFNGHPAGFDVNDAGTTLVTEVPHDATTGPLELVSPTPPQVVFGNVMSHWFLLTIAIFTALAFAPAGLAAIADEAEEGAQGTTMSAYSLTLSLGFIIGPPILGYVSESYGGAGMVIFYAVLAAALLAMVLTHFVRSRTLQRA
ncbi:MAG TPA: MFS transporter [Candidatus Thermoplasmatota archaeon]|nr:MFS transporter [Candidatus Thermoplasmatota archaeon]